MANSLLAKTRDVFSAIKTDSVLVAFSGGKDSLVLMDLCKKQFVRVVPFYMYFVEGLEHVEKKLKTFEKFFETEIIRVPHWMLSHYYARGYFRLDSKYTDIKRLCLRDIENSVRLKTGIEWVCNGMRATDSIHRAIMFKTLRMNSINDESKRVCPLSHWKNKDIRAYIKTYRLPAPFDYGNSRVSGIDINKKDLAVIRDKYYKDYQKILAEFPFADSQLYVDTKI